MLLTAKRWIPSVTLIWYAEELHYLIPSTHTRLLHRAGPGRVLVYVSISLPFSLVSSTGWANAERLQDEKQYNATIL